MTRALPFAFNAFVFISAPTVVLTAGAIVWEALAQPGAGGGQPDPPAANKVAYAYDENGMLVRRLVTDGAGAVVEDRRFLVDDNNPTGLPQFLAEVDGPTSRPFKINFWGPDGLRQQTEFVNGNEIVRRYPTYDARGSVRAVRHVYTGGREETTHHDYTAFGVPLGDPPAVGYAFHGQWRDPATGLQFHRARWYDPKLGQWLSPDPAFDFPGGHGHAFNYAGADPVNRIDPTGEQSLAEIKVVAAIQGTLRSIQMPAQVAISLGRARAASWMLSAQTMGVRIAATMPTAYYGVQRFYFSAIQAMQNPAWARNVWRLGVGERGRQIHQFLLRGLPNQITASNFPVIDRYWNGVAQSIKSIHTGSPSYQSLSVLQREITKHIDTLARWQGTRWGGTTIRYNEIQQRILTIVVPVGEVGESQMRLFANLIHYAQRHGVILEFIAL